MSQGSSGSSSQSFGPTSGLVTGWIGSAIFFLLGVAVLVSDELGWAALLFALALVMWCFLARPRVLLSSSDVELRNAFSSWLVPLTAVDDIAVRHSTVVTVRGQQYAGDGVGRSVGEIFKGEERGGRPDELVARVRAAAAKAKGDAGEVTKVYAVPHLVVLGALVLAFLVLVVL